MNILTIAPGHENYWWWVLLAIVVVALALIIGRDALREAVIPPDEKEENKELFIKKITEKVKPVTYKRDEEIGYDSHVTVNKHPYFSGEYYSSN